MTPQMRILLADDDPDDVFFTREAFSQACPSAEIHVVTDGQEAVDYLSGTGAYSDRARFPLPSRVLLDLKLPRRSGLEVLGWMKRTPGLSEIPVTILTGSKLVKDRQEALALGAADFLTKPVDLAGFTEMIKAYCARA